MARDMKRLKIITLVENTTNTRGLVAEHGLSFWIEFGNRKILFDTGQGNAIRHNSEKLGIRLEDADVVILSHGHYDHTGGLRQVMKPVGKLKIFAHPAAFGQKYSKHSDGSVHDAGIQSECRCGHETEIEAKVNLNEKPVEVFNGFHLTGPIPRQTEYEDTGGMFFTDTECSTIDSLPDDQAAFIETSHGIVVILGCAHSGVINTLNYVRRLTNNKPIHSVIGGMHLVSAGNVRIGKTIWELKKLGLKSLMPAHCTGFPAMARMWHELPGICRPCSAGTIVEIGNR